MNIYDSTEVATMWIIEHPRSPEHNIFWVVRRDPPEDWQAHMRQGKGQWHTLEKGLATPEEVHRPRGDKLKAQLVWDVEYFLMTYVAVNAGCEVKRLVVNSRGIKAFTEVVMRQPYTRVEIKGDSSQS